MSSATRNYLPGDETLAKPLALANYLLAGVQAFALGFSDLGAIELPPIVRPEVDRSHLQMAASLYLAAELEAARLVPVVETLAGLFASGGLRLEEEEAASLLYRFWQQRNSRFSRAEREALFARLFGHPSETRLAVSGSRNRDFESHLISLAETILAMQPDPVFGTRHPSGAALSVTATRLAFNLVARSGGITAFAARDLVQTIQQALAIMKVRSIQATAGGTGVWSAVQAAARIYLGEEVNARAHVERARSGMLLLTWVGEVIPQLDGGQASGVLLSAHSHLFGAAASWLQATHELRLPAQAFDSQPAFPRSDLLPQS